MMDVGIRVGALQMCSSQHSKSVELLMLISVTPSVMHLAGIYQRSVPDNKININIKVKLTFKFYVSDTNSMRVVASTYYTYWKK